MWGDRKVRPPAVVALRLARGLTKTLPSRWLHVINRSLGTRRPSRRAAGCTTRPFFGASIPVAWATSRYGSGDRWWRPVRNHRHDVCDLIMQMPSKRPAYRADRVHQDFLAEISGLLPEHRREPRHFEEALQRQVEAFFQRSEGKGAEPAQAAGTVVSPQSAAVEKTHDIVDRFLEDRSNGGEVPVSPIGGDELAVLYQELAAANPQFTPRTYIVDDLHTLLEQNQQ